MTDASDPSVDEVDLDAIRADLDADRITTRREAAEQCVEYVEEHPERAPEVVGVLVDNLDDDALVVAQRTAESISEIAQDHPDAASDAAAPLIDTMEGSVPKTQFYAAAAVRPIAADQPTAFADRIEEMLALLQESIDDPIEYPAEEIPNDEFRESLDYMSKSENQSQMAAHGVVANVITALAEERPDLVAPHVGDLAAVLETDVKLVVSSVLDAVAVLADHDPDTVSGAVGQVVSLLEDEDEQIRARAVKTLGFVGDPSNVDVLRGVAKTDSSEDVRALAEETVSFIDQ